MSRATRTIIAMRTIIMIIMATRITTMGMVQRA